MRKTPPKMPEKMKNNGLVFYYFFQKWLELSLTYPAKKQRQNLSIQIFPHSLQQPMQEQSKFLQMPHK